MGAAGSGLYLLHLLVHSMRYTARHERQGLETHCPMSASHVFKSADATARPAPPRKAHSSTYRVWSGAVALHITHSSFFACPRCCPFCRLPAPVVLCRVAASIFEQANREQHDKHHHQEQQQQQELEQQQTDEAQEASAGEAVQQQGQASGGAQDPGGSLSAVVSNGGAGDVAACQRHLEQRRQRWWQQMQLREQGAQEAQQQQQEPGEHQQQLLADGLASLPEDVLQSLDTDGSLAGCLSGVGLGGGHC